MEIINTFKNDGSFLEYDKVMYASGNYKILTQPKNKCYLYTYKNIALFQLLDIRYSLIDHLVKEERPLVKPDTWFFDSAIRIVSKYKEDNKQLELF